MVGIGIPPRGKIRVRVIFATLPQPSAGGWTAVDGRPIVVLDPRTSVTDQVRYLTAALDDIRTTLLPPVTPSAGTVS